MRVAFAGTPEFARLALERIRAAGHDVALVLSQPDRPGGRGMQAQASPVARFAREHGLALAQPRSLRLDGRFADDAGTARAALEAARPDAMVVAAYGLLLPQWVLDLPRLGCLNIHGSLLPRWRGAAPIQRAIEAGDAQTGITIMQMDAGLDTGPMLLREAVPIAQRETAGSLHDKLADLGARLIVDALQLAGRGELQPVPQPGDGATYARKIEKAEAPIDWSLPADAIGRHIRAFDPVPGACAAYREQVLKLWRYEIDSTKPSTGALCGTILSSSPAGIDVACGADVLRITELQRSGGKRLSAAEFLRGFPLPVGARLEAPAGAAKGDS